MMVASCCLAWQTRVHVKASRRGWIVLRGTWNLRGTANGWEKRQMRGLRYDRILAGTALALVLAAPYGAQAQKTTAAIEAEMPLPDQGAVPPPTSSDVKAAPAAIPAPAAAPAAPTQ